jgi:hypothetical protein
MATRTFTFLSDEVSTLPSPAEPPEKAGIPARTRIMSSAHAQAYEILEKKKETKHPMAKSAYGLKP